MNKEYIMPSIVIAVIVLCILLILFLYLYFLFKKSNKKVKKGIVYDVKTDSDDKSVIDFIKNNDSVDYDDNNINFVDIDDSEYDSGDDDDIDDDDIDDDDIDDDDIDDDDFNNYETSSGDNAFIINNEFTFIAPKASNNNSNIVTKTNTSSIIPETKISSTFIAPKASNNNVTTTPETKISSTFIAPKNSNNNVTTTPETKISSTFIAPKASNNNVTTTPETKISSTFIAPKASNNNVTTTPETKNEIKLTFIAPKQQINKSTNVNTTYTNTNNSVNTFKPIAPKQKSFNDTSSVNEININDNEKEYELNTECSSAWNNVWNNNLYDSTVESINNTNNSIYFKLDMATTVKTYNNIQSTFYNSDYNGDITVKNIPKYMYDDRLSELKNDKENNSKQLYVNNKYFFNYIFDYLNAFISGDRFFDITPNQLQELDTIASRETESSNNHNYIKSFKNNFLKLRVFLKIPMNSIKSLINKPYSDKNIKLSINPKDIIDTINKTPELINYIDHDNFTSEKDYVFAIDHENHDLLHMDRILLNTNNSTIYNSDIYKFLDDDFKYSVDKDCNIYSDYKDPDKKIKYTAYNEENQYIELYEFKIIKNNQYLLNLNYNDQIIFKVGYLDETKSILENSDRIKRFQKHTVDKNNFYMIFKNQNNEYYNLERTNKPFNFIAFIDDDVKKLIFSQQIFDITSSKPYDNKTIVRSDIKYYFKNVIDTNYDYDTTDKDDNFKNKIVVDIIYNIVDTEGNYYKFVKSSSAVVYSCKKNNEIKRNIGYLNIYKIHNNDKIDYPLYASYYNIESYSTENYSYKVIVQNDGKFKVIDFIRRSVPLYKALYVKKVPDIKQDNQNNNLDLIPVEIVDASFKLLNTLCFYNKIALFIEMKEKKHKCIVDESVIHIDFKFIVFLKFNPTLNEYEYMRCVNINIISDMYMNSQKYIDLIIDLYYKNNNYDNIDQQDYNKIISVLEHISFYKEPVKKLPKPPLPSRKKLNRTQLKTIKYLKNSRSRSRRGNI